MLRCSEMEWNGIPTRVSHATSGHDCSNARPSTPRWPSNQPNQTPTPHQLQFTGVDSVLTADLGEGKEVAKQKRKSLNTRCDLLRDRILKVGEALKKAIVASA